MNVGTISDGFVCKIDDGQHLVRESPESVETSGWRILGV